MSDYRTVDTQLIHSGTQRPRMGGAVVQPIFQTANYEQGDEAEYGDVRYMRMSNSPNHRQLAEKLAAIEGAESATVAASGMAAITATLVSRVQAGDHILAQASMYGGTRSLLEGEMSRLGVRVTFVDSTRPGTWAPALQPTTRVFYVEGVSNPMLEVTDLPEVVSFARSHGLVSIIDNTFLSPVNFRPLEHGFDLVVHSATKYLNGHSDLTAGVVAGSANQVEAIRLRQSHLGGSLDAHACFLLDRGMRTLALRMKRHNQSALRMARWLAECPEIARVHYPGLSDHPGHDLAKNWFSGFGGVLSFTTHDSRVAAEFVERVEIPVHAASLGGVETLVVRPSRSTHLGVPPEVRERLGITDALVRVSVGIEDSDELIEDMARALAAARAGFEY